MATTTERFGFTKPAGVDPASIVPLNLNTDNIELYLGRTQDMIAPMYDNTLTYSRGDIRTYNSKLYKANTDINTPEDFDEDKWDETTAVSEGSGGGTEVIPNPQGTPTDTLNTVEIDGTIYEIEGSGGGGGVNPANYSTNEVLVGVWVDNLPVYKKTWTFTNAIIVDNNSWADTPIVVDDTDINIVVECEAISNEGVAWTFVSATTDSATTEYVRLYNPRTNASVSVKHLTLYYTKVGDTPITPPSGGGGGTSTADAVTYDNTDSGLTATNVQDAIDEVVTSVASNTSDIADLQSDMSDAQDDISELNSNLTKINYPIKSAGNNSLGLSWIGFGAQIDSSRILVILPLPFIANDTNYSVEITTNANLIGIASVDKNNVTVDAKLQTGVRLIVPYTGTARQAYAVQIGMTITY